MNHPNAFMDPIGFSCILFFPRTFYMARGDAFKKGLISKILTATGIIPIFRMRDAGIEGVRKNNESFSIAYRIWNRNHKIMVFAEGLCVQERRLRSIQKGTARMAFGFMEEYKRDDFLIVPVGVNYSCPTQFRTDFYCEAGDAIAVKDFYELYKENPAKGVNTLTKVLEGKMQELVPSLIHKENDELVEQLQPICKHEYLEKQNLDESKLEHHQSYWKYIIQHLNEITGQDPEAAKNLRIRVAAYTKDLSEARILDRNLHRATNNKGQAGVSLLLLIFGFPFYFTGKLLNFVPWYGAKSIAKKTAKNIEFYTSVNYVTGLFLSLFYFIAELLLLWFVFGIWWYLIAYAFIKLFFSLIALAWSDRKKEWMGEMRMARLNKNDPDLVNKLKNQRSAILSILTGK